MVEWLLNQRLEEHLSPRHRDEDIRELSQFLDIDERDILRHQGTESVP